jgi:hypothetical protein
MLLNLEQLIQNWETDSAIDKTNPDNDLLKIPNLHSKYAAQFVRHTSTVRKLRVTYNELLRIKTHYYSGNLNNKQDLARYNYEPFNYVPKGKNDIDSYLNADPELNKIKLEIGEHDDAISFCEMIVKEIGARTFQIRSWLDYSKYKMGH